MGILNITPDSFSDGGLFRGEAEARAQAERLAAEGAAILDIGGESTRPGHTPVPAEEEQARVLPVIRALAGHLRIPISIDTYKASTADLALAAGAGIVNDVWGLQREPDIASVAAAHGAPVIVMHNRETIDPGLDIVADMLAFFDRSLGIA
ncbi:MAG: dihydropteroate synthase, partial [Methylobacterium sp.]